MDLLAELTEFHRDLKVYKELLNDLYFEAFIPGSSPRKFKVPSNERAQIVKQLEEKRDFLVRKSGRLIPSISDFIQEDTIVIHEFGKPRSINIWMTGLREEFDYRTAEALNACIDITNKAISKLEMDIEKRIRNKQGKLLGDTSSKRASISELPLKVFNVKGNWESIENEFGITKNLFGRKINFVSDTFRRKIIFRDVEHAYMLASLGFSKSAVILAGGVIEELLRLYLEYRQVKPIKDDFDGYIKTCEQRGLLKVGISRLSDSARHFRNLVHLEKEKDTRHSISKVAAIGAVSSIFIIANDF